jgi:hypothetical protein
VKEGIVGRLFGFNVMMRSGVVTYDNSTLPVVNAYMELQLMPLTMTDVLCWQTSAIERALGQISFFERIGDPTYFGDVYSVSVRVGGRIRRLDATWYNRYCAGCSVIKYFDFFMIIK